jgi:hypothetical protein
MMTTSRIGAALLPVILCAALCHPAAAQSFRVHVRAKDDIYRAGETRPEKRNYGLGLIPPAVSLPAGTQCITFKKVTGKLSCASSEGCITIDNNEGEGTHYNDPDGVGAYPKQSSNTGTSEISGITAPYAGYLVGLFTPPGGPSGSAPDALDFTQGKGTAFKHLAPKLDQTFFIGDGLTGDATGNTQKFSVPPTAATLYLGISDAPGFNGTPGAYLDNVGAFQVILHASPNVCRG